MIPVPTLLAPFVGNDGRIKSPWNFFLQQFVQAPPPMFDIDVGPSAFSYQAVEPGFVSVVGAVISVALVRGTDFVNLTGTALIPVAINDFVVVNYAVAPQMKFIPNYGQRTG
jgi:hypothetical protein